MAQKRKTTVRKTTRTHKKTKQHPKHFLKVYWPYIPILAIVTFAMLFSVVNFSSNINQPATLAYSTEMSISGLLSGTNEKRASNGLNVLLINSKLNASAQAKAQDMVNKDYWSHNSPNGDEPWVFLDSAGYIYQKAGENLAYGFNTSSDTIIGWMNSPSHRANLLDDSYTEVGFGFVNSSNFVETGQETIVVAHYAKPIPPPKKLVAEKEPVKNVTEVKQATEEVVKVEEEPLLENEADLPVTSDKPVPDEIQTKNITRLQQITGGNAPWSAYALSLVAIIVTVVWLLKHMILVKRFIRDSEHFVAHHPLLDLLVVIIVATAIYFSQFTGSVI